ncbi:asparaginase [Martelella soudanensis]|uniref:asparaginase n=1 Tax=unclassified Martelella TaxID=2629616 RepID=UPI001AED308E|nr:MULTISPECIES: asparaginase [unclassified Martelella]
MKRVVIFGLGGTIASTATSSIGVVPQLDVTEIIDAVPSIETLAKIECVSFRNLPGAHLCVEDLFQLATDIEQAHCDGADGVVVVQGTDTIEETAYVLDLLVGTAGAVVVTGAMRNPTLPSADGPANLLAAVTVASTETFGNVGTVVVLNDSVHAAAWVRKAHTGSPSAFASPMTGPMGWISEKAAYKAWSPTRPGNIATAHLNEKAAKVALLNTWLGDDGGLVRAVVDLGFDGVVIAGLGGGHTNVAVASALEEIAKSVPVVIVSRVGAGETLRNTYGFLGSEMDLASRGLVSAASLDGVKARLLLTLLLSRRDSDTGAALKDFQRFSQGYRI